jgi:hypothetical protein
MRKATLCTLVLLLAGCGGGWKIDVDGDDDADPAPSGLSATLEVSAASDALLNGSYTTGDLDLGEVERSNEADAAARVCRFRFDGLRQGSRRLAGTVTYAPVIATRAAHEMRSNVVTIGSTDFTLQGGVGVAPVMASNKVLYANAVLTSAGGATITLSGELPVRSGRPTGC